MNRPDAIATLSLLLENETDAALNGEAYLTRQERDAVAFAVGFLEAYTDPKGGDDTTDD